jgi:spore coat protein CotH
VDASGACNEASEWSEWAAFRTDDGSAYLFDPDRIHDVYIDIEPDSFNAINAEAVPPGCVPYTRPYHPVTVRFEDQVFAGAGGRVKGGCGSARDLSRKAGFKLNLSYDDPAVAGCPDTRRLFGLKRLTLNNMVQDRSYLHESIGYQFYKAMGVPTPRTAHVRVFVNDELWGLYLHVESIDRRFLARWFESNQGMMYEGTYWCDLVPENLPPSEMEESACLSRKFSADECSDPPQPDTDPTTYGPLTELVEAIDALPAGEFYPAVESFFDFDTLLSSWATDAVMAHWDGYQYRIMNNYRVYHNPATDRWTIIPTGIDQTFVDQGLVWSDVSGVLARRCLQEPDCEAAIIERIRTAIATFQELDLGARAQEIHAKILPHVLADPRREFSETVHMDAVAALQAWIAGRPEQMLAQLP